MDALELLKQDHAKVKELLEKAESAEQGKERTAIFEKIKTELETHARIEENVFYPAVQKNEELKDMVLESIEEHKQVKTLLREMDNLSKDSEKFEPKLKVLMEDVEHHVMEEEGEMFKLVEEQFDEATLSELGEQMETEKEKFAKSQKASSAKS